MTDICFHLSSVLKEIGIYKFYQMLKSGKEVDLMQACLRIMGLYIMKLWNQLGEVK